MVLILDGGLEHDVHVCGKKQDIFLYLRPLFTSTTVVEYKKYNKKGFHMCATRSKVPLLHMAIKHLIKHTKK